MLPAALDWTALTGGLQTAFEAAVTEVLPIVGVIMAAFLAFRAIKRFVRP